MRYAATLIISWEPALWTLMERVGDEEEVKNIFTHDRTVTFEHKHENKSCSACPNDNLTVKKKLIICYFGTSTSTNELINSGTAVFSPMPGLARARGACVNSLYFSLCKAWILVNSASSAGVEYDAIDEDNASSHLGKIWYIHSGKLGCLWWEFWSQTANPFLRYKSQIIAHSASSTGVENDVIEDEDTIGDKSGIIREVVFILCVYGEAKYLPCFVNRCGEWCYRGG